MISYSPTNALNTNENTSNGNGKINSVTESMTKSNFSGVPREDLSPVQNLIDQKIDITRMRHTPPTNRALSVERKRTITPTSNYVNNLNNNGRSPKSPFIPESSQISQAMYADTLKQLRGEQLRTKELTDQIKMMHDESERHRENNRKLADERDRMMVEIDKDKERIFTLEEDVAALSQQVQRERTHRDTNRRASGANQTDPAELFAAHELNGKLQLQLSDSEEELRKSNIQLDLSAAKQEELQAQILQLEAVIASADAIREEMRQGREVAEAAANAWHANATQYARSAQAWQLEAERHAEAIQALEEQLRLSAEDVSGEKRRAQEGVREARWRTTEKAAAMQVLRRAMSKWANRLAEGRRLELQKQVADSEGRLAQCQEALAVAVAYNHEITAAIRAKSPAPSALSLCQVTIYLLVIWLLVVVAAYGYLRGAVDPLGDRFVEYRRITS